MIFPVIVVALLIYIFLNRNKIFFEMDKRTIENLDKVNPEFRNAVIMFLEEIEEKNLPSLTLADGLRTPAQQQTLYNQGRTTAGKIVTNAKPWDSLHQYGMAGDFYQTEDLKKGKLTAPTKAHAEIGKKYGLFWGGNFAKFKDLPHFELTKGLGSRGFIAKYKPLVLSGKLPKDENGQFIFK